MKTIVCLDGHTLNPGDNPWQPIERLGHFTCYERSTEGVEQIIERTKNAQIVLTNKTPISKRVIDSCPSIECIVVLATGYNVIDIQYAREKNIPVLNVPAYATDTVAEMVFAHIFQFARNLSLHSEDVRSNLGWTNNDDWTYWLKPQIELAGKTIGIIGFGKIGQRVGEIAHAFRMKVLVHEHFSQPQPSYPYHAVDLGTLLSKSDFVSLHCPALPTTENLINQKALEKMPRSALLINTSRGQLINEQELANALNNGTIAGAALDTLWQEPPAEDNPLLTAKNCVITPHLSWTTVEARRRVTQVVAENIQSFLSGNPQNVVN